MDAKRELIETGVKVSDWNGRRYNYPAETNKAVSNEGPFDLRVPGLQVGEDLNRVVVLSNSSGFSNEIGCVTVNKKTFDARLTRMERVMGKKYIDKKGIETTPIIGWIACFEGQDGEIKVPCEQLGDVEFVEPTTANILERTQVGALLTTKINYKDVVGKLLAYDKETGVVTLAVTGSKEKEEKFEVSTMMIVSVS